MKRTFSLLFSSFLALFILLTFSSSTYAAKFEIGRDYTLDQSTIIEDDLFVKGGAVEINGVVDGDLFASGNTVNIDGTVTGDLFILAKTSDIQGNVYGNVFVLSQDTDLSGIIGENFFTVSMTVMYDADTGEDAYILAGSGSVLGNIGDDLRAFAGQLSIESLIRGDAMVSTSSQTVTEENITGNYYDSATLTNLFEDVQTKLENTEVNTQDVDMAFAIFGFIGMYIVGAIFIALMPTKSFGIKRKITESTGDFLKSMLLGGAIFILIPVPLVILCLTIFGLPVAMLITGLLIFVMVFGKLWVEMAFGEEILELFHYEKQNYYLSLLVGRTLTLVINFIPILRGFYSMVITATALGAVVRMKWEVFQDSKKKKVKKTTSKSKKK